MASVIQAAGNSNGSGSATSLTATFGAPTGANRRLTAFINVYNGTSVSSVTDDRSNTWAFVNSLRSGTDANLIIEEWAAAGAAPGVEDVTVNLSGGSYVGLAIIEVDGGATDASNDAQTTPAGNVTISGAPITAGVDGLHLAAMAYEDNTRTFAPGAGWTEVIEVDESNSAAAVIVAARAAVNTVQQTPTWTTSGGFQVLILHSVIANASAPPAGNRRRRLIAQ